MAISFPSVVDTIHMISIMEVVYIGHYWEDIYWPVNWVNICCKLFKLNAYILPQVSSWLLIAATFDRTIAILFPHKVKIWITRRRTIVAIVCMTISSVAFNSHLFWNAYILTFASVSTCYVNYDAFPSFGIIHVMSSFIIPSALIIVGNGLIIYKVYQSTNDTVGMHADKGSNVKVS